MSRAEVESAAIAGDRRSVPRVLDLAFGFFVWAAHFLVIYIATAVSCVLDPVASRAASNSSLSR